MTCKLTTSFIILLMTLAKASSFFISCSPDRPCASTDCCFLILNLAPDRYYAVCIPLDEDTNICAQNNFCLSDNNCGGTECINPRIKYWGECAPPETTTAAPTTTLSSPTPSAPPSSPPTTTSVSPPPPSPSGWS